MTTPFDRVVEQIRQRGYHNQRLEDHSDLVSDGILNDLRTGCEPFATDLTAGNVRSWKNVRTPGGRSRKIDLLVGESDTKGEPNLTRLRICIENKSVITAHRNQYARFDDLNEALQVLHHAKAEAVLIATVIVGVSHRVLNVPDKIKPFYKNNLREFSEKIVPRLSSGDRGLWEQFHWAISSNRPGDAAKTVAKFRSLPTRHPGHTHVVGYDYLLIVPMFIDNVNPPYIPAAQTAESLGIDVEAEYQAMLDSICRAYRARWHL